MTSPANRWAWHLSAGTLIRTEQGTIGAARVDAFPALLNQTRDFGRQRALHLVEFRVLAPGTYPAGEEGVGLLRSRAEIAAAAFLSYD